MLQDTNTKNLEAQNEENKTNNKDFFTFLHEENLSKEEFEKRMNYFLSITQIDKENISLVNSINNESLLLIINNCAKSNNLILAIKLFINLAQIKNNLNSYENLQKIDFNEYIINCFKKLCELVELIENSLKSDNSKTLSTIINNYEDILLITSDYFSKIISSTLSLSIISKYIYKVVQEKIFTFYLIFSIILYNLCKNSININIKEYIDMIKINQLPLSSSALNSYIDYLCRSNRLEDCQSFFEEILSYKPLLIIPYCFPITNNNSNININPNESKAIYEKHISSFGINIVSFGIFLKYLCKSDHLDLALLYFDQLNSKKMLKDEIIFNLILNGCSKKGDFENLYRVYEEMLNNGIKPTNITMNTIIDAFIRSNELEKAWKIFGEMYKNQINPDNFTLSTLFRGIKTMDHYEYLIKGIDLVKKRKNDIDIILINVLLDACIKLKDSKDFLDLFDSLIKGKFSNSETDNNNEIIINENNMNNNNNKIIKPDLITYNTFIKGCTQLKLYDKVDYVFEHLIVNNETNITPNDVTFNSLIDAYVRQNNMNKVFTLISKMQQYHIKPDNFTYTTIIKGLNKDSFSSNNNNNINDYKNQNKNELDLAFQLFEKVKQFSRPDEILYNCIMDACLRFNNVDKMLELYKEMLENNIPSSSVTCGIVIKGYGMKGDVDSALKIYQHMKINKIEISSVTYGCLINVCTKNNKLSKAFELYESLTKEGIEMNTILYTTLIKAYSKTKNINKVIEILNIMIKSKNAKPNIITYNSVIDCCIKCQNFDMAYKYYNYLIENNKYITSNNNNYNSDLIIRPDIVTFSTLIKGEIHNGCFGKAKILMNKMLEYDYIKPDCILLNTLLDGCEKCNCYEDALDIYNLFRKKNVSVNMMTYSILLKILGVLGDFENSLKLFEEIKMNNKISMNLILITCFIKTCFSTNHIQEAIDTFNSFKNYKINPDAILYITMINGIINNSGKNNNIDYTKEIIKIIKKSATDGVILQDKNYLKIINYLKKKDNNDNHICDDLINFLKEKGLFDYHRKNNKNKNYINNNNNKIENIDNNNNHIYNYENIEDNKENDKEISKYKNNNNYQNKKNKFNNNNNGYEYNKNRKPFKQIFYNNINNNSFNNNKNNFNWKKNNYNDYNFHGNSNEINNGYNNNYSNYNNYGFNNNKWNNSYNKDNLYYKKKESYY